MHVIIFKSLSSDGPSGIPILSVEDNKLHEGEKAQFSCKVFIDGNPTTYTYTWRKDGEELPVEDPKSSEFELFMAEKDTGNYTCQAKNDYGPGSEESEAVELFFAVGPAPPSGMICRRVIK